MYSLEEVEKFDAEVAQAIENETGRQRENIGLFVSKGIRESLIMAAVSM